MSVLGAKPECSFGGDGIATHLQSLATHLSGLLPAPWEKKQAIKTKKQVMETS